MPSLGTARKVDDIPAPAPAPNIVRLVAKYSHLSQICENVMHFSSGGAPTVATMNALIDAYISWETTYGKVLRSTGTALLELIATDLTTSSSPEVDRQVLPQIVGVTTGNPCPGNCTLAFSIRTSLRGRSYRGRIYHIGLSEGNRSGNEVASGYGSTAVSNYSQLLALGVAPIFHLGVLSRRHNNVDLNPAVWTQATAITTDGRLDSQRRRLEGRGI